MVPVGSSIEEVFDEKDLTKKEK